MDKKRGSLSGNSLRKCLPMVHFSQIPIAEATVRVRKLNQLSALILIMRPASRRQRRKLAALAGTRSALVKFTTGAAEERHTLDGLWSQLAGDFKGSGLVFASLDCSAYTEACAERKISLPNMKGPIIKFWTGEGSFRRYAGRAASIR